MPGFGARIRPDQVTPTARRRLAKAVYRREFLALSAVFVPCLLIAGAVIAFYHSDAQSGETVWHLLGPIVVTAVLIGAAIHIWGLRERKFVETAPVAAAVIKELETSTEGTYKHRLILSYRPIQYRASKGLLPGLSAAHLVIAACESDLPGFSHQLASGDSLSILYDPEEPEHICIVQEEQKEAMHPSAA